MFILHIITSRINFLVPSYLANKVMKWEKFEKKPPKNKRIIQHYYSLIDSFRPITLALFIIHVLIETPTILV